MFANVRAVLEASGAAWSDLVDVTVFLTDMQRDFATYNRLYAEYFAGVDACRTTLGIHSLPTPIAIELKCVAALDGLRPAVICQQAADEFLHLLAPLPRRRRNCLHPCS